jgi:uncharacterized protein (TIGR02757 family)
MNRGRMLADNELKQFLDEKYLLYNQLSFVETDPIQVPHSFSSKEDIETSAFLTSMIAWGKRSIIINNAKQLMKLMDNSPYDFIINAGKEDLKFLESFKHRTFNAVDLEFFILSIRNIYKNHGGLEKAFEQDVRDMKNSFSEFRKIFFSIEHPSRSQKHVPSVDKNSAAKRLNLFLMWMVRHDKVGVHFGLWKNIESSVLKLPLDVHTANVGRKLGMLTRKQNDWQAVEEITSKLTAFDRNDPVKYDFALFGLGVFEKF